MRQDSRIPKGQSGEGHWDLSKIGRRRQGHANGNQEESQNEKKKVRLFDGEFRYRAQLHQVKKGNQIFEKTQV